MNNYIVEKIDEYLPQESAMMNLLFHSDDYGRSSATNMLWYKDTGTAGANSGKYRTAYDAPLIPDNTWTAPDHTTMDNARAMLARAAANLDNPHSNQGFRLRKALTPRAKDTCLVLSLSQIFASHKDIDAAFIGLNIHTSSPEKWQMITFYEQTVLMLESIRLNTLVCG